MGLFKRAESEVPLDPEFFAFIVPKDKRAKKALARAQAEIRRALLPDEKVTCIAVLNCKAPTVVTDCRIFALHPFNFDQLIFSVDPDGLDVEWTVEPAIDRLEVVCTHPKIPFDVNGTRAYHWFFKDNDDLVHFAAAVKLLIKDAEMADDIRQEDARS